MKDTLIGIVLGDGYLEPHGRGVRLQVLHSAAHRPHVEWKWTELMELQPSPLHYQENGGYPFWRFVTKCHPILKDLRSSFYRDGRKVVPDTIGELLVRPKSLAVWFMDDGTIDNGRDQCSSRHSVSARRTSNDFEKCCERTSHFRPGCIEAEGDEGIDSISPSANRQDSRG